MKLKLTDFAREGVMKFLSNSYLAQDFPCFDGCKEILNKEFFFEQIMVHWN